MKQRILLRSRRADGPCQRGAQALVALPVVDHKPHSHGVGVYERVRAVARWAMVSLSPLPDAVRTRPLKKRAMIRNPH